MEYYKFVKLIGKGAFGKVMLGVHKLTGKQVAIKTIDKVHLVDDFSRKKLLREIYILKKIKHINVIRLLEVFETQNQVLMVMEYAGSGDLLHYVKEKKFLTEKQAKPIFRQVVYGLAHIHSRNVVHRDIKLDNILLDSDGGVKICDFGVSKVIDKHKIINDQCGTPAYIAPEIISKEVIIFPYILKTFLGI
jgi:MAP/microtubule affinity-regulating kinase